MFKIELNLLLFYIFQHGIDYFIHFAIDGLISHSVLHLLLLLVILWIYGRERFQRDEFMSLCWVNRSLPGRCTCSDS